MSLTGIPRNREWPASQPMRSGTVVQRVLLITGVLSSLVYVAADLVSASLYPGYSLLDHAISELSAIGAPTQRIWSAFAAVYDVLLIAFGIGVMRVAGRRRALRVSGGLLIALGAFGALWAIFPMHQRGTEFGWTDVGHMVMSVASVLVILLFIGFGAAVLGRRFRIYSLVTVLVLLAAGALTFSWAGRVAAGEPTAWLGLVERFMIYGYLLWVAVFAVALLSASRPSTHVRRASV